MAWDTETLARLMRARRACLAGLRDIGKKQIELVEQGNMTALLDVLAAKHRPLAELQRIERALDPFRKQHPEDRCWASPEDRAACARQSDECEALLAEILRQEKQCEQALLRQRGATAARLARLRLAGQVRGAYAATPAETRHIDLCSER
ncbi:MAG: hypothetical protein ABSG86_10440 [Thermoguttaceae bacterium]|jgi:hypothetical protein